MKRSPIGFWITSIVLIFLYLPIVILVINSFNESRFGGQWLGFTFKWYEALWNEPQMWHALANSLIIALSATITSTIIGTCAAFALQWYKGKLQTFHYGLIYTPLIIPDILMGISLLLFFVALNGSLGLTTIFIAHTTFCISYVTMVMISKLQNFDFTLIEAAQDLGANKAAILRRIMIPLLAPGLMAGALLAFILSIDEFVITYFVAGQGVSTLPIYIYTMIKFGSIPIINALSVIILTITIILICLTQWLSKEEDL